MLLVAGATATTLLGGVASGALRAPVNLKSPVISGTAVVGKALTASHGSWSGSPTLYSYHWLRCVPSLASCAPAGHERTRLVRKTDVGFVLEVRVTALNAAGRTSALSAPTGVVSSGEPAGGAPHVMLIVEENRSRGEVIGNPGFPYLNSLATKYGNTTAWSGVSHPSLPNYLALVSGSTQGVADDGCGYSFAGATIGSQLSIAGIGWRAYMEALPSPGSTTCEAGGGYAKKHNPFAYFPASNGANVVPAGSGASQLKSDLVNNTAPPFLWLTPSLCNDGHDCSNETTDSYLKGLIPTALASKWYAEEGTVIITWDEDEGEGRIATVVLHGAGSSKVLTTAGNHYGTLATIEQLYGVPRLGRARSAATLAPLLK